MTLSIPRQRDPLARAALLLLVAGVIYALTLTVGGSSTPQAQAQDTILYATATPALPAFTPAPVLGFAVATPTPAPGWLDQGLAAVGAAGDQFAQGQADQLAQEQDAARIAAEQSQYIANVGAQAEHSPRGDVSEPAPSQTGPIVQPASGDQPSYIIAPAGYDPKPAAPLAGIAEAVPQISQEQAAVIGARQSNGCAVGEVFYPRTGCHQPGSGGPQPGAVGAP